ncbi:small ribosomal subunit Rsm22 family protein [Nocardia sp. BMG51109]|uniref:small ribosomal subunit Rsm22 family protein n=1 Tax=Nocardia sp. BMG51109 TaxID=1056816 RepID=UPI0004667B2F|nr:small ribosomal subunit Rsm22 family protein [Nocardia sp. BMG51109]
MPLPVELVEGLDRACAGIPQRQLAVAVDRLISRYRDPRPATEPILGSPTEVAAYAAYRMPATFGAVYSALEQFLELATDFRPETLLDVGGGTGAALWAAADLFPSLTAATVLDQVDEALRLGRRLAERSASAAVRSAGWRRVTFAESPFPGGADLVVVSYVLSELSQADQSALIARSSESAEVVTVIEPGTPDGHQRILAAREVLIDAGLTVVAPCPHQDPCPLADGADWCHFSARINRTSLHRRLKGGELSHEDEKFSYVIASRTAYERAAGRILRHPVERKGLVTMQVCTPEDGVVPTLVAKRQGRTYRRSRKVEWGDAWPPSDLVAD